MGAVVALSAMQSNAQPAQTTNHEPYASRYSSTTPKLHYEFPFQMMWDDAVLTSVHSGKPTLAFDLDLDDSVSIRLAQKIIDNKGLRDFITAHFEPAMNDFAVDPPPAVGMDSLKHLGWRLSGLEKDYGIMVRPAMIVIGTDKKEIDRIVFPEKLTAKGIEHRLTDILQGRNTLGSTIAAFWRDTTSIVMREKLIDMFEQRSKYDSVLYHLQGLAKADVPSVARTAAIRYAYLRLQVEGNSQPLEAFMAALGPHGEDSTLHYALLDKLLDHYKQAKNNDSVAATYDRIMAFTGQRDPDLLNDYAWQLANYSKDVDHAYALVNEAIGKNGQDADYYDTRALVDGRMHHYDEAIRDEETAVSFAKKDDKSYFEEQLGYYKKLKGEVEKLQAEQSTKAEHPGASAPNLKKLEK
ncbi:MAG TPA: hypothetical protein VFH95_07890 [Candidatus Kapabacteria bacterium]|nr:hypothetical protein [Candidatus Kapabacteria bacterium]